MCKHAGCELSNPLYSEVHPGAVKTICLLALRLQRQGSLYRDVHDTNDIRRVSLLADDGYRELGFMLIQAEWNRDIRTPLQPNRLRRRFCAAFFRSATR
ncbi:MULTISPECIES: hypothetical protein [unclassified Paenibacillus]|uniref:hypothetical protein n=1 Tax=unclassified Paenibacillus TaxID=185978 RepID=UPI001AE6F055|nr:MULTISPECIES: hypothetical protein [unclassified Paenibacillus]MBP1153533.1 hypothetical protein [Paenibacillus sp. PvP091]MBP1171082.1 hypothetical protein [Paenibacillus sp. PvR098]MBP2442110.1 hypothetical protein [Paenibacillus sp. PvP052]